MENPVVTLVIPNFKTPVLTKLCFRLIRKYNDFRKIRVIAVDNASGDASVEYLRTLPWITLLERAVPPEENGPEMHARALDMALEKVTTPFVLVMHTDTLILSPDYLDYLLDEIGHSGNIAGVGSWKLEQFPLWKRWGKACEDFFRRFLAKKKKEKERYLRSHCAMYRTDLIREKTSGFFGGSVAGKVMHRELTQQGYEMKFLPPKNLGKYIRHLDHATGILNPTPDSRLSKRPKVRKKLNHAMQEQFFQEILNSPELDH